MENEQRLVERIRKLESRVDYLEKRLAIHQPMATANETGPKLESTEKESNIPEDTNKKEPVEWDTLIFQKILPRLFIIVFLIGILWGFKAASDYGILTDTVKVFGGFLVGLSLIVIGMMQVKKERGRLGKMLIGGAIPIFMLTTFSMHQLYDMTGPTIAFTLNVIWIAMGGFFTYHYRSQGIGIISSIGGVFVPFLIESVSPNIPVFILYETILYILFIWLSLKYRFQLLYYISAIFLHIALFIFSMAVPIEGNMRWFVVIPIIAQQFALLTGFITTKTMLNRQAYTLFASVIFIAIWLNAILIDHEAAIIFGLIALLYSTLFVLQKEDSVRSPIFIANGFIALLFFVQILFDELLLEALIGTSILYMFVAHKYKSLFHALLSTFLYLISFTIVFHLQVPAWISWELLHWVVFLAGTGYAIYYLVKIDNADRTLILNIASVYYAIMLLVFTSALAPLIAGDGSSDVERMILSSLWIVVAILFMVMSKLLSLSQGKYVGVGILFLTLGKVIIVDIYFTSVIVRAFLFLLLGLVGLFVSRVFYKNKDN